MLNLLRETGFDGFGDFSGLGNFLLSDTQNVPTRKNIKTDIKEYKDRYELKMNMPGFSKENVSIELCNDTLTISATVKEENSEKDEDGKFIRRERFCGSMSRSFYVDEDVSEEDISANFKNGVLTITVAKKEPVKPEKRSISIE